MSIHPASCHITLVYREERNAHARQLLEMLKCGKLEEPFTGPPPLGALKTTPHSYDREGGGVFSSSLRDSFSQPPKSSSPILFSSLVSSHKVPSTASPAKPTNRDWVAMTTDIIKHF